MPRSVAIYVGVRSSPSTIIIMIYLAFPAFTVPSWTSDINSASLPRPNVYWTITVKSRFFFTQLPKRCSNSLHG